MSGLPHDVRQIASCFQIEGEFLSASPYGAGHINDTYCAAFGRNGVQIRHIIQRINHNVFKDPAAMMENIQRVTAHLHCKFANQPAGNRRALNLILARDGASCHVDKMDNFWRAYHFIEGASTRDTIESAQQAFEAAKAFGQFQQMLADLPAPRLHDSIPDFHNTPKRFAALEKAIAADAVNRARRAGPEIKFALQRKNITSMLLDTRLPERVTHNDTKLNNVLLDDQTGEGVCVIDLDTVMPGLALYDFGDIVRTATCPAAESERDLSKVQMQLPMFETVVRGYLEPASGFLTKNEKQFLAFSGKLITFETGIRFLTDFLSGDTYFKVDREAHNLDRCRTQFRLIQSIEEQEEEMNRVVEKLSS